MTRQEKVAIIKREKLIAIVRAKTQQEVNTILLNLIAGGVKVLEVTSNTPGFLEEIHKIRQSHPDTLIGAGTITNPQLAQAAIEAGAQFLVSPNVNIDIIPLAHQHDVPIAMGALTPTEVCTAVEHGADIIKLFPAGNMGIGYFRSVRAPLDQVSFFVVGGIRLDNLTEWMDAGAAGVGLGSNLTHVSGSDPAAAIKAKAKEFLSILKQY